MKDFIALDVITAKVKVTTSAGGNYDENGKYQKSESSYEIYNCNIQPLTEKERQALPIGGQRIISPFKIYLKGFKNINLKPADTVEVIYKENVTDAYRVYSTDIRQKRQYCKIIVGVIDD